MTADGDPDMASRPSNGLPSALKVDGTGTLENLAIWGILALYLLCVAVAVYAWRVR